MKLAARQIEGFVKQPPAGVYAALLYGPDQGLAKMRGDALMTARIGTQPNPFALMDITSAQLKEDPARLADALSSISLLGGPRVIVLRDAADGLTKIISPLADLLNAENFLLVLAGDLPARSTLRQWFEKQENTAALPCYVDDAESLHAFIRAYLSERGYSPDRDVLHYLTAQLGIDRLITRNELDKLILYIGAPRPVTLEDAQAIICAASTEASFDAWLNAVMEGKLAEADGQLQLLFREGENPVALIRAAQRHFDRILRLQAHVEHGTPPEQALQQLRPPVFFKHTALYQRALRAWKTSKLRMLHQLMLETELELKSTGLPAASVIGMFSLRAGKMVAAQPAG